MSLMFLPPLALPSSGSGGRRGGPLSARLSPRGASSRWCATLLGWAPGRGQEVGEDAVDVRIQGQADMAALNFDCVQVRAQASFPVDHAIGARIDRCRGDSWLGGEVAKKTRFD